MSANSKSVLRAVLVVLIIGFGLMMGLSRHKEKTLRISAQDLADRLAGELVVVHEKLDEAREEIGTNRAKWESAAEEKKVLESKLAMANAEIKGMKAEIAQLKLRQGSVDLGKVDVAGGAEGAASAQTGPAEGSVMAINKDYGFIIINLGAQNGIREGMKLLLIQDGILSSELRVDMVDETICAAAVLKETLREIRVGDQIRES